ncbi:hypothetical protein Tco_0901404 [Tanacetum coccineum]
MLKRAALGGINIHTTLDMAWNTGSLSHALCASPVDPLFMEMLLEHNIKSDGVQFSTDGRMRESQKVGTLFPGRLVAWDRSSGKARRGYVPGRLTRATSWDPYSFSQINICHDGGFSSVNSHSDAYAIKEQKTIDEIKSVASMQGYKDFDNFKAARMYGMHPKSRKIVRIGS